MRKLLQSKAVVSGLCAVAGVCVAANFVKLPARKTAVAAARELSSPPADSEPESYNVPRPLQIRSGLSQWREMFSDASLRRDPFSLRLEPAPEAPVSKTPPPTPKFTLSAVSLEPGRALAVLDHTVVGVGDRLGDYTVEKILPGEVWLKSAFGRVTVALAGTTQSRK